MSENLDALDDEQFDELVARSCYGWRLGPCPLCGMTTSYDGPHGDARVTCPGLTADEIERLDNPRRPRPRRDDDDRDAPTTRPTRLELFERSHERGDAT